MRRLALLLAITAAPAFAEDRAHRPIDVERHTEASLEEAQACLTKWGRPFGKPQVTTLASGTQVDFKPGFLQGGGEPYWGIDIVDRGEYRSVTLRYRHPWSNDTAKKFLINAAKKCALGDEVPLGPTAAPPPQ